MKKSKSALITLLSLATLFSCTGGNDSSTSSSAPTSSTPTSENSSESSQDTTSSTTISSDISTSSEETSSEEISSSEESSETSEESSSSYHVNTDEENIAAWGKDLTDPMIKHLGGTVIPYCGIDTTYAIIEWVYKTSAADYGHLELTTTDEYTEEMVAKMEEAFINAGYAEDVANKSDEGVSFTNADKHVIINAVNVDGNLELDLVYDEPYSYNATDTYSDDLLADMKADFGDHAIPYVYIATKENYIESYRDDTYTMTLTGGKWDKQVLTDGKAALEAAGATVTTSTTSKVEGTYTYDDGSTVTMTLNSTGSGTSRNSKKVQLKIVFVEGYNPDPERHRLDG